MIGTVTLNPSVDISYKMSTFLLNDINRVEWVTKTAGGKGLNVSRVLNQLGEEISATGFIGGELGMFIEKELHREGIHNLFTTIQGETRNCIAIIHDGMQTEILETGPFITGKEQSLFLKCFTNMVSDVELVTISGSLPQGVPSDFYRRLLDIAVKNHTAVLLDTKADLLIDALRGPSKPVMIKPNLAELSQLVGKSLKCESEIIEAVNHPLLNGIAWIVVTLGEKGAIVKHLNAIYRLSIPNISAMNPVGSGDAVVAGFASGLVRKYPVEELMKYALSMGVLNALEEQTGTIRVSELEWCRREIKIEKL